MFIEDESELVMLALDLEQKGGTMNRARARAVRGVTMPLRQHMINELPHWKKNPEEMFQSMTAFAEVLGSIIVSVAFSSTIGQDREGRLAVLDILIRAMTDRAQREEATATALMQQGAKP